MQTELCVRRSARSRREVRSLARQVVHRQARSSLPFLGTHSLTFQAAQVHGQRPRARGTHECGVMRPDKSRRNARVLDSAAPRPRAGTVGFGQTVCSVTVFEGARELASLFHPCWLPSLLTMMAKRAGRARRNHQPRMLQNFSAGSTPAPEENK